MTSHSLAQHSSTTSCTALSAQTRSWAGGEGGDVVVANWRGRASYGHTLFHRLNLALTHLDVCVYLYRGPLARAPFNRDIWRRRCPGWCRTSSQHPASPTLHPTLHLYACVYRGRPHSLSTAALDNLGRERTPRVTHPPTLASSLVDTRVSACATRAVARPSPCFGMTSTSSPQL